MSAFANRLVPAAALLAAALLAAAGCSHPAPPGALSGAPDTTAGVTANSGGDTRGTVLYHPAPPPSVPLPSPYAAVSDKVVLPERQKIAYALAEIDQHAHAQAVNASPVPFPGSPGYSRQKAQTAAERQALLNVYLLEKYHARFCNQFHVTYDQLALIAQEGRDKNWPLPPPH